MARWIRLSGRIEDDHGTRHALARVHVEDRLSFRLIRGSFSLIEQERQADPAQRAVILGRRVLQAEAAGPTERVVVWVLAGLVGSLIGVATVIAAVREGSVGAVLMYAVLLGVVALDLALGRRQLARRREELRSLPPVCLACAYSLAGLAQASDGCTLCPECGAAWRLGRVAETVDVRP